MPREELQFTMNVGDISVPEHLIDEINESGYSVMSGRRGMAEVDHSMSVGAYLKIKTDFDIEKARDAQREFEANATETEIETFYNPTDHVNEILGTLSESGNSVSGGSEKGDSKGEKSSDQANADRQAKLSRRETKQSSATKEHATKLGSSALRNTKTELKSGARKAIKVKHDTVVSSAGLASKRPATPAREKYSVKAVGKRNLDKIVLKDVISSSKEAKINSEPRFGKLKGSLGRAATQFKELPRQRDVIDSDEDSKSNFTERVGNRLKTKEVAIASLGAAALTGAVLAGALAPNAMEAKAAHDNQEMIYAGVTYAIEQHRNVDTTAIVIGGNKEWRPSDQLVQKALDQGVNVEGAHVINEMGPIAGTVDSKESLNDGASTFERRANELLADGQNVRGIGYSWGSVHIAEGYHRIKEANGGTYPEGIEPPVLYGAPLGPNGAFKGPFGKIAMGVLGVNPQIMEDLPRGTTFVYGKRDPFATAGPGSQPLTDGFNVLMIAKGSHGLDGEEYITVEDDNGNFHKIKHFDAAKALGITGAGHDELNAAIDKLFPVNNDPDSKVRPKADAIAALFYGAQALDRMIDGGTGKFTLFEDIQAQLPPELKKLLGDSVDGMNDSTVAVMECFNTGDMMKCKAAFDTVMETINKVMGNTNAMLGRDMVSDIKNGGISVAAKNISQYSGLDYNMVRQQLSSFTDMVMQPRNDQMAVSAPAGKQSYASSSSAPTVPLNLNNFLPNAAATIPNMTSSYKYDVSVPNVNNSSANFSTNIATPVVNFQGSANANVNTPPPYTIPFRLDVPRAVVSEPAQPAAPVVETPFVYTAPIDTTPRAQVVEPATPNAAPVEAPQPAPAPAPAPTPVASINPFIGIPKAAVEAPAAPSADPEMVPSNAFTPSQSGDLLSSVFAPSPAN